MDYQKAKLYKITSVQTNKVYFGSTCQPRLCDRLAKHTSNYRHWVRDPEKNRYMTSFEIIKLGDAQITLLESFPCHNKDELLKRERYYIGTNQAISVTEIVKGFCGGGYLKVYNAR